MFLYNNISYQVSIITFNSQNYIDNTSWDTSFCGSQESKFVKIALKKAALYIDWVLIVFKSVFVQSIIL